MASMIPYGRLNSFLRFHDVARFVGARDVGSMEPMLPLRSTRSMEA